MNLQWLFFLKLLAENILDKLTCHLESINPSVIL